MKPRKDPWSVAIEKAEADLRSVEKKLEGWEVLMKRRDLLRATIENLKVLRGNAEPPRTPEDLNRPTPSASQSGTKKQLLWQQIVFAMQIGRAPTTPGELALALEKTGPNDREMIRQALVRRTDLFEKLPDGRFTLKNPQTRLVFRGKSAEG